MNIKDTLTYLMMVPLVFGILASIIAMIVIGATGVAGVVIGVGEWLAQN